MLYHFTSCESLRKILLNNKINFSKSMKLDDPFERARSRNYLGWYPNIPEKSPLSKNNGYFNARVNLTNILCFFDGLDEENKTTNPLLDLKMWSHYGKNHQGCCILFNKKKAIDYFCKSASEFIFGHGRVSYNDLQNYIPAYVSPLQQPGFIDYEFQRIFHHLFFNKDLHYLSENEYRFVVNNENSDFSLDVLPILSKVAIAENANEDDLLSIVNLCELLNIEVGRMIISENQLKYFSIIPPDNNYDPIFS